MIVEFKIDFPAAIAALIAENISIFICLSGSCVSHPVVLCFLCFLSGPETGSSAANYTNLFQDTQLFSLDYNVLHPGSERDPQVSGKDCYTGQFRSVP
jgi:hypothetical protein